MVNEVRIWGTLTLTLSHREREQMGKPSAVPRTIAKNVVTIASAM